jgi:hypothetical protein
MQPAGTSQAIAMKLLGRFIHAATISALLLVVSHFTPALAQELADLTAWTTYYYLHPQPHLVPQALKETVAKGYFENDDAQAGLSGFWAEVFRTNPDRIEAWVKPYLGQPGRHILYSALWVADTPQSKSALKQFADAANPKEAAMIQSLLATSPPDIASTVIDSPAALDFFWGRFMGSGCEACVIRIIDQIGLAESKGNTDLMLIGSAAQWSLSANVRQHARVLQIVKAKAATAAGDQRKILDEILHAAQAAPQPKQ